MRDKQWKEDWIGEENVFEIIEKRVGERRVANSGYFVFLFLFYYIFCHAL